MDDRQADPGAGARDETSPSATPASDEVLWPAGFAAFIKLGVLYQKASRCLSRELRRLNLTVAQFDALANLYQHDGVPQNELARRLLVTKGNMTGLVGRLEERALLERRPDPQDARVHQLHLTAEGRALAKNALVLQRDLIDQVMGPLSAADRNRLRNLAVRCIHEVDRIENAGGLTDRPLNAQD